MSSDSAGWEELRYGIALKTFFGAEPHYRTRAKLALADI
jgi:hypothetical protein